ncbi:MAG: rod shape-determining protein RodA [Oxalobacter sp.]|nr:MAG: rod shape-determining protein RodA [Oxalobacter sp.]
MEKINKNVFRRILSPWIQVIDVPLAIVISLILLVGLATLYSASGEMTGRVQGQLRNIAIAVIVMWGVARIPPQTIEKFAVPLYTIGMTLLIAVFMFGLVKKGARRWLNIGVIIQPAEIMKIAVPMMLAWFFQKREGLLSWKEFAIGAAILAAPVAFIMRQPDLGTAMLVLATGFYVIYLAGLSWKVLVGIAVAVFGSLPLIWPMLHGYQRQRIMTLLDPTSDPLGKGFHIIQSKIAVGSGGLFGKGWLNGTQAHLEFLPERTTDFIFAVYSEEFGLLGNMILLGLFLLLIGRGILIASEAPTMFTRLLAGAITLMFFTYAFVNMGMVSGILPVVGVPLPFMSYGGTAMVTLGLGTGILMSIHRHRQLVQS